MELINILKRYLMSGVPKMVVKIGRDAKKYETLDIMKKADIYIAACRKVDTFNAYRYRLTTESLSQIRIYDKKERQRILNNPGILEKDYRDRIPELIEYEREKTIREYVEENEYYRMLNGQPSLTDTDFIYPDTSLLLKYGFKERNAEDDHEHRTPLHLLPENTLKSMDSAGILDDLQKQYPDKKYISYLGHRKIPIVEARSSHNFELLYYPKDDRNARFYKDFLFYYEESREYFMSVIYNHSLSAKYEYYDGFIGFMILAMTIQRVISGLFKIVVERDFYDLATLRLFLESFGVPFVELFTVQQQRMLVKNLNILLMKKQGTQVMYDILDLLGYDSFTLIKYVLVKQHKMERADIEADLKPVFIYRTVINDDGTQVIEIDVPSSFDYYFVGLDMREDDVRISDINAENSHPYDEFTIPDPTWIEDEDLAKKLQEKDFNFIETKYVDISLNIRMQEKAFEMIYLQRMLLDKKEDTGLIYVQFSRISETPINLLEIEVLLICLMCKHYTMKPLILRRPSQILAVLGFDFKEDYELVRQDIISQNDEWRRVHGEDLFDPKVLNYLYATTFSTAKDVNDFFVNIRDFEEFMSYAMLTTHSIDAYYAYRKLYNTVMITTIEDESYQDSEGNPLFRYDDYLKELNMELYTFYDNLASEECSDYINYIATKFSTLFEDTQYMGLMNAGDAELIEGIIKILKTFKSLTIDIRDMEVVWVFDSRTRNTLRLIDEMMDMRVNMIVRERAHHYTDYHNKIEEAIFPDDNMIIQEAQKIIDEICNGHEASFNYHDAIDHWTSTLTFHEGVFQRYRDYVSSLEDVLLRVSDKMMLDDRGCAMFIWDGEEPKLIGGTPT